MSRWRSSSGSSGARRGPSSSSSAGENRSPNSGEPVVPLIGDVLAVMAEIVEVELERAVWLAAARSGASRRMHDGLAIGREPHDLVLVAVVRKAEILRERLVEDAERMREIAPARRSRCRVPCPTPQAALRKVAEAIDRDDDRLLERRDVEGRGEMREMMLDVVKRRREGAGRETLARAARARLARARRLRSRSTHQRDARAACVSDVARACAARLARLS